MFTDVLIQLERDTNSVQKGIAHFLAPEILEDYMCQP